MPAEKVHPTKPAKDPFWLYTVGFIYSLLMTLTAYLLVTRDIFTGWVLVASISILALIQLGIQLFCFLHLSSERPPRWNIIALIFAGLVTLVVVFGSLWIMYNLDHNMGMPRPSDQEIIEDEGIRL